MIVRKYYKTRKDKVKLYKTYSDNNKIIHKIGTDEEYDIAIDVENAPFEYEETDKDIPKIDEESKEINLSNKEIEQ